ncbi:MAG: recombination mediator RecR [Sediminibacterium sp.]|nr:recombination mediator RecR [Sediminibacterium sp.]
MQISSTLIEKAVEQFTMFPGVGKKSALRMVLHLLKQDINTIESFVNAINTMCNNIKYCQQCFNISDENICSICANTSRNKHIVCVVENIRDIIAIENTQQFNGTYHVLGGVISPLDGVGPNDLQINSLIERIKNNDITEILFALSPNIQGDTTIYYIQKNVDNKDIKITTISRGVAFGGELEYADDLTLAKSIYNRQPINHYLNN